MKRLLVITLMGLVFLGVFSAPAVARGFHRGDIVKVMTRNQYLGANLDPVILAESPEEFFRRSIRCIQHDRRYQFTIESQALRHGGRAHQA